MRTIHNEVKRVVQEVLQIIWNAFSSKGFFGLYRGYLATVAREIPFSVIQFPLWEYFKVCLFVLFSKYLSVWFRFLKKSWSEIQGYSVHPWQGALCGSLAGGIAACLTTPFGLLIEFDFSWIWKRFSFLF